MGDKLNTPSLCASFASGTVGPNQNIIYAQMATSAKYDALISHGNLSVTSQEGITNFATTAYKTRLEENLNYCSKTIYQGNLS